MRLVSHNSAAFLVFPETSGYLRLTREILDDIEALLARIRHEPVFHGVVIAANSRSWPTGAELAEVTKLSGVEAREFASRGQRLYEKIARFPLPVVAAVRGFCLGGGLDLALACRARVASLDASFGCPGAALGLITGWGGTWRLPRLIGKSQALEILLTTERVPATQALTLGLVDEVVPGPDLWDAAAGWVERLSSPPGRIWSLAQ
jgi:enoyl-CoA hydratase/carnithine racemase